MPTLTSRISKTARSITYSQKIRNCQWLGIPVNAMVSENKYLRTVSSLPRQRIRVKISHVARLFFALYSFKNIKMRSAMDWRADFRNCKNHLPTYNLSKQGCRASFNYNQNFGFLNF